MVVLLSHNRRRWSRLGNRQLRNRRLGFDKTNLFNEHPKTRQCFAMAWEFVTVQRCRIMIQSL